MSQLPDKRAVLDKVTQAAMETLAEAYDTLVTPDDLEIHLPNLKFGVFEQRKACQVTCSEFGDFYMKVFINKNGVPVDSELVTF